MLLVLSNRRASGRKLTTFRSDDGRREPPEPPAFDRNLGVDRERETPYIRPRTLNLYDGCNGVRAIEANNWGIVQRQNSGL